MHAARDGGQHCLCQRLTTVTCPYPQAPASTVSSLLALNRTPRPQLAQESLGRDKEMGLTAQKEPAVLLAVPGYIQNWKIAAQTPLTLT